MNRLFLLFAKAFCCIALCCIVPVSCGGGDVEIPPPPSTAPGGGDDNPDDDEPKPDPNPDPDEPTRLKIVDPQATDQTKALYSNLWAVASRGFMFGHHDDLWYGRYWYDVPGGSDTRAVCGDYPAVFSVDLAPIMDNRSDYESDRKENAIRRRVMLEAYGRGEVIVACCHLNNPLTGGDSWDNGNTGVVRAILDPQSPQACPLPAMARPAGRLCAQSQRCRREFGSLYFPPLSRTHPGVALVGFEMHDRAGVH